MPTWILIVALLSIAATAALAVVLRRINAPADRRRRQDGGDTGPFYADTSASSGKTRSDAGPDGSHGGGGDGGGGDGGGD